MTANEWLKKNNIDLSKYHGNVGDYEGNICIETDDGWIFWNAEGKWEKVTVWNSHFIRKDGRYYEISSNMGNGRICRCRS